MAPLGGTPRVRKYFHCEWWCTLFTFCSNFTFFDRKFQKIRSPEQDNRQVPGSITNEPLSRYRYSKEERDKSNSLGTGQPLSLECTRLRPPSKIGSPLRLNCIIELCLNSNNFDMQRIWSIISAVVTWKKRHVLCRPRVRSITCFIIRCLQYNLISLVFNFSSSPSCL